MSNELITPEQMAKDVYKAMEDSGYLKMWDEATDEEREAMGKELMNFFGCRFP